MVPDANLRQKLSTLPVRLRQQVVGQDEASAVVAERLQHGELELTVPGRPKAGFLFLGPTGVGKTELSLRFTEDLIGGNKLVRLDMSEYQTQDRLGLLLGTSRDDPGRIAEGYDACGGVGTLLLDEIEKAHRRVLDILLQILEPARLTTGGNRVLDFSSWYVVLTSNIGASRILAMRRSKYETMARLVLQDAQLELRPEIFGRITAAVVFNKLGYDAQCEIAAHLLERELLAQQARGHRMTAGPGVVEVIVKRGYSDRFGARPMRDAVELLARNALARDILEGGRGNGTLRAQENGMALRLETPAEATAA